MKCSGINCPMQYPYDVKKCLCVDTCPYATTVPYTNAERIRAMSDEEMAYQFGAQCPKGRKRECDKRCSQCWLEWLQQPCEGE